MDELLEQFLTITGVTDREVAKNYLEACGGNIDLAISMHMDSADSAAPNTSSAPISATNTDDVRAPIPQKREVLVQHDHYLLASQSKRRRSNRDSVFDRFRDFQAEAREQENRLKNGGSASANSEHLTKLEDLFRPPLDIIHHGSLQSAQTKAKLENKWVLANIQNTSEFSCQVLNRDIWKDPHIRSLVSKRFIFWQVYHDTAEGSKYTQFYPVSKWPYIAVLHPLTAELQHTWNSVTLKSFTKELEQFIKDHHKPDGTDSTTSLTDSPFKVHPKLDISEESQLEAAIQASLRESSTKQEVDVVMFDSDSDGDSEPELETFSASEDEEQTGSHSPSKRTPNKSKGKQLLSGSIPRKSSQGQTTPHTHIDSAESSNWKDFISEEGTDVQILLRKPDQTRCQWCVKSQSKLKALTLYVTSLGYETHKYEIVSNFPRRKISELAQDKTFADHNFQKQETFYVQER